LAPPFYFSPTGTKLTASRAFDNHLLLCLLQSVRVADSCRLFEYPCQDIEVTLEQTAVPRKTRKKSSHSAKAARAAQSKFLYDHVVGRICRVGDAMIRMSSRHIRKLWNLRHTDLRLLNILDGDEPVPVIEISRRALVDQAWVSRSLRALETAKLVERCSDPEDSRLSLFSLTERGRVILDEFRPYAAWSEKVLLNGVDAAALKALLDRLENNTQALMDTLEYMPRKPPREK